MEQQKHNREFIIRYINAVNGVFKAREPADKMTAEGNRVTVRARTTGVQEGEFSGILPAHRKIEMPFC